MQLLSHRNSHEPAVHRCLPHAGYTFYLVVFFTFSTVLVASFALCVVVGHAFRSNSFPWVWPLRVLKVAVSLFFEIFYISR